MKLKVRGDFKRALSLLNSLKWSDQSRLIMDYDLEIICRWVCETIISNLFFETSQKTRAILESGDRGPLILVFKKMDLDVVNFAVRQLPGFTLEWIADERTHNAGP